MEYAKTIGLIDHNPLNKIIAYKKDKLTLPIIIHLVDGVNL